MKQMTEAELRDLLDRAYEQGYEDGQNRVHNAAHVDRIDHDQKNSFVDLVLESV